MFTLGVAAILYTSLVAFAQKDMKKLIAYSSVAHMGFVTIGVFSGTSQGAQGAVFQMISHGIVSGALFLSVGVVYDRMHTREIAAYGGLADRMPIYAFVFMVFTMANVGLPGTSGFIGEFLTLLGTFQRRTALSRSLQPSGSSSRRCTRSPSTGTSFSESWKSRRSPRSRDMTPREIAIMAPLVILTIVLGFYPKPVFDTTAGAVKAMIAPYEKLWSHRAPRAKRASPSLRNRRYRCS